MQPTEPVDAEQQKMYDFIYQLYMEKDELLEQLERVCKEKHELVRRCHDHTTSFSKVLSFK